MKSRDEIVIIIFQWMRLYTLGSKGSRELKTFVEIRLLSSRIDQKFTTGENIYLKTSLCEIGGSCPTTRISLHVISTVRSREIGGS